MSFRILRNPCLLVLFVFGLNPLMGKLAKVDIPVPEYELPKYLADVLSEEDRDLFTRLLNINIESAWGYLKNKGYPYCFTNAVEPVAEGMRLVGRARTCRYLPYRQDLADQYTEPQLNIRSAEDTEPGDIIVFDMGGSMESSPSGDVSSTRAMVKGCAGVVVNGIMRDLPAFINMGMPLFTIEGKGHAAAVKPGMTSWDYQTPVRVGDVTIVPGDYIIGAAHGILVIPGPMVMEVLESCEYKSQREEFQRQLLLEGRSMIGVYPPNKETQKAFEEYLKTKKQ